MWHNVVLWCPDLFQRCFFLIIERSHFCRLLYLPNTFLSKFTHCISKFYYVFSVVSSTLLRYQFRKHLLNLNIFSFLSFEKMKNKWLHCCFAPKTVRRRKRWIEQEAEWWALNYILIHRILLDSIYSLELTPPWNMRIFLGKTF